MASSPYPPTNAPRSPVCRSVPIPDNLSHGNPDGTNRLQNADGECSGFDKVTVTRSRSTVTRSRSTVALLRVAGTHFAAATALKQRRIDIFRISGAGRIQDLHPQNSTVTTVTRGGINTAYKNAVPCTTDKSEGGLWHSPFQQPIKNECPLLLRTLGNRL